VIACLRGSASLSSSGNHRTIGVSRPGMSFCSIAMPTSGEMTLFDADCREGGGAAEGLRTGVMLTARRP